MSNPYSRTFAPGAVPTRNTPLPKTASRVPAHSENASADLNPVNAKTAKKNFGKIGLRGDGQQT